MKKITRFGPRVERLMKRSKPVLVETKEVATPEVQPTSKYDSIKRALANAYDSSKKIFTQTVLPNSFTAYPTLGNLARDVQEKAKQVSNGTYSPRNATLVSSAVNIPVYAGLAGIAALFTGNDAGTSAGIAASYAGLEGCFRSYSSAISGKGTASVPGKILGMPVELAVNVYNRIMKRSARKQLKPEVQAEHDTILNDLSKLEANPKPRKYSREDLERIYARQAAFEQKAGPELLKFAGEFALATFAGAVHEVSGLEASAALQTLGMLAPIAVVASRTVNSGNRLRTVPALAAGYVAGRFVGKALKAGMLGDAIPNYQPPSTYQV